MEPRTIEALFIDKFFVIPEYQGITMEGKERLGVTR